MIVGITLCVGDTVVPALGCLGGEYEAMLAPARRFLGCPKSGDSSDEDNSVISPYRLGFFLSRTLRLVDAFVETIG